MNKYIGSSLDDFLKEEGIYEEAKEAAIKKIIADSFANEMKKTGLTKTEMARRMQTSRTAVDRLLDGENKAVTLNTLIKAAQAIGREFSFRIEFAE
ncbi:MAG: helix-turn-helix domain-containing protein [Candidatus Adiutrix sp.]|jgi:plasmid maintenance system antidote protein VapI|nr:helix-turn-helix domain-containing protein [Candidatus Adiutrix sp.]